MVLASQNSPALRRGARGTAVALLQGGLIQLGFPLPISTQAKGAPDGTYGYETKRGVEAFQTLHSSTLKLDGVAGKNTILKLDQLLSAVAKPPKPSIPVKPPVLQSVDYMLGSADPHRKPDSGAGPWNSQRKEASYIALGSAIVASLPVAYAVVGGDATAHMAHYFGVSGRQYKIDLEGMVREVPSAKEVYEDEVAQAQEFAERLPLGRHSITSRKLQVGYNGQSESKNWYFAIGGYSVWGKGTVHVIEEGGTRHFELDFEYQFFDRYNWDAGKSVTFAGLTITDQFMGEFHRQGLAREFDCRGAFKRKFSWNRGQKISQQQLSGAGGRG